MFRKNGLLSRNYPSLNPKFKIFNLKNSYIQKNLIDIKVIIVAKFSNSKPKIQNI